MIDTTGCAGTRKIATSGRTEDAKFPGTSLGKPFPQQDHPCSTLYDM
ncbi:hypothetical protein [Streptomyces phaeochromogenes]